MLRVPTKTGDAAKNIARISPLLMRFALGGRGSKPATCCIKEEPMGDKTSQLMAVSVSYK
jgi:hypothetical protein